MEILGKLFGTAARVKMMRLFLFNPDTAFSREAITNRTKEPVGLIKREVALLSGTGLIREKSVSVTTPKKKKVNGWILNKEFMHIDELRQLLLNTTLVRNSDIIKRLQKSGKMKLIVLAGVFIQNADSRLDLFVVGDGIKKGTLESAVKTLESEIGKELKYVWFDTNEFTYRVSMYDKLIRDILDFPHEKILNRLNVAN